MDIVSNKDATMIIQIKLMALSKLLIAKGIITEEELVEEYELTGKQFQQLANDSIK